MATNLYWSPLPTTKLPPCTQTMTHTPFAPSCGGFGSWGAQTFRNRLQKNNFVRCKSSCDDDVLNACVDTQCRSKFQFVMRNTPTSSRWTFHFPQAEDTVRSAMCMHKLVRINDNILLGVKNHKSCTPALRQLRRHACHLCKAWSMELCQQSDAHRWERARTEFPSIVRHSEALIQLDHQIECAR